MKTGALLLAAGFSHRFGRIKLAEPLADGKIIFQHTLENIAQALTDIIVISRPDVAPILEPCLSVVSPKVTVTLKIFDDAELGMGASLAFGMQQVSHWDGCLVCLADMPFVAPSTYARIAAALQNNSIVIPHYQNKPGNPVAFGRKFYPALQQLQGDSGGRFIIDNNPGQVQKLNLDDPALLLDIDTPQDLHRHQPL